MLPATVSRVENATSNAVNRRIAAGIEASVRHHAGHPEQIGRRLDDLDREWDVERTQIPVGCAQSSGGPVGRC